MESNTGGKFIKGALISLLLSIAAAAMYDYIKGADAETKSFMKITGEGNEDNELNGSENNSKVIIIDGDNNTGNKVN